MFKEVTLEISLKPFKQTDDDYIKKTCATVLEQWKPLCKDCQTVSVMFWTSDGSEILNYNRDLDTEFEWCSYIGNANCKLATQEDEDKDLSPHKRKRRYMADPPVMTYRILKKILSCFKQEALRVFPKCNFLLGETFDLGPEFAVSDFKYRLHPEICSEPQLDSFGFLDSTAVLNADSRSYAAYPNGIIDNTPFATFFGKQSELFLKDMGFDFLWLSNGMGFSTHPWNLHGKIYDGKKFYPERLSQVRKKVYDFWRLFRKECPDIPIRVRGTNNSAGIDYATDGVPLYDIFKGKFGISSIPNSPWAALNDDYGLEIMGHMTRISELPGEDFMFRFYIHDPWWHNSPWYDRYDGFASDIYLPMSVSRINFNGNTESASTLQILSVDNSFGNMPDSCVFEPLPHLLKAAKNFSDEPAPLVWVYPVKEYTTAETSELLSEMYFCDNYIRSAINNGLPLNCVVSSENFLNHTFSVYKKSILVSPVQPDNRVAKKLCDFAALGGKVILYGSSDMLGKIEDSVNIIKVDIAQPAELILRCLERLGIFIRFNKEYGCKKPPTITINRHDNGMFFSVYNSNTTTDTMMRFPLGAPILSGGETKIINSFSVYRFTRCEHRECRVFVKQNDGVVSLHEAPPLNTRYRRRIRLSGLQNATVCFFPEYYCSKHTAVSTEPVVDNTPIYDTRWKIIEDNENGLYYKAENISGEVHFLFPFSDKMQH